MTYPLWAYPIPVLIAICIVLYLADGFEYLDRKKRD